MAAFSCFAKLPSELRLLIWEAAILEYPSVHFVSYPRATHVSADNPRKSCRWHSEILGTQRTMSYIKDPELRKANIRMGSFDRYSAYMDSLSILHACRESRRVCLSRSNKPSNAAFIGPFASIPIDLDRDIVCIQ